MEESVQVVSEGMKNFIDDFHKHLYIKEENYVVSAYSAHLVLSMAVYGAGGKTADEMRKVLYLPSNDSKALKGFQTIIVNSNKSSKMGSMLKVANKICPSDTFTIEDKFIGITKEFFRSKCQTLNFRNSEESAARINKWCSKKTRDKINNFIKHDELSESTKLILINAVYFKGIWSLPFDTDDTKPCNFYINTLTTVEVPMMSIQADFQYTEFNQLNAQSLRIPFEDSDKYMEIIVPRDIEGLSEIEKNLEKTTLSDENFRTRTVNFKMPKFKIETTLELKYHLKKMGMTTMFDPLNADFSNTTDKCIFVNRVKQKAFIQVDESGCEAAAVTYISEDEDMCYGCFDDEVKVIYMKADRPFLFRIYDDNSRTFIFVGRVMNPLECLV